MSLRRSNKSLNEAVKGPVGTVLFRMKNKIIVSNKVIFNLLSVYDVISSRAIAAMLRPVYLNQSYCSSGLTQHL